MYKRGNFLTLNGQLFCLNGDYRAALVCKFEIDLEFWTVGCFNPLCFNAKIELFIEIHWWLPRVEKLSNLAH